MPFRINADYPPPPANAGFREEVAWAAEATGPIWAEDDTEDGWTIAVRMALRGGEWVAAEFRMFPRTEQPTPGRWSENSEDVPGSRGLTATDIRNAQYFPLVTEATRRLQAPDRSGDEVLVDEWWDLIRGGGVTPDAVSPQQPKRVGRPALPDVTLAHVAVLYDLAFRLGEKAPIFWIAEQLAEPNPALISQRVHKARKRGFLTEAPAKGVPGGSATPKAFETLRVKTEQGDSP